MRSFCIIQQEPDRVTRQEIEDISTKIPEASLAAMAHDHDCGNQGMGRVLGSMMPFAWVSRDFMVRQCP
jgi:hypothetical protein